MREIELLYNAKWIMLEAYPESEISIQTHFSGSALRNRERREKVRKQVWAKGKTELQCSLKRV